MSVCIHVGIHTGITPNFFEAYTFTATCFHTDTRFHIDV